MIGWNNTAKLKIFKENKSNIKLKKNWHIYLSKAFKDIKKYLIFLIKIKKDVNFI